MFLLNLPARGFYEGFRKKTFPQDAREILRNRHGNGHCPDCSVTGFVAECLPII